MIDNLIIAEHDGKRIKSSSLSAISFARQLKGTYGILVLGSGVADLPQSVCAFGAAAVMVADHPALSEPLADRFAPVIAEVARKIGAQILLGTSSTFTKDVLPRVAALLDAGMVTDVMGIEAHDGEISFKCPLSAGSLIATVKLEGAVRVLTVRGAAFTPPSPDGSSSPVEKFECDTISFSERTQFIWRERSVSARPELTEARVVVGGGRPLNNKETFDRLIGGLADVLGGAVGATRAAVDAGVGPEGRQGGEAAQ